MEKKIGTNKLFNFEATLKNHSDMHRQQVKTMFQTIILNHENILSNSRSNPDIKRDIVPITKKIRIKNDQITQGNSFSIPAAISAFSLELDLFKSLNIATHNVDIHQGVLQELIALQKQLEGSQIQKKRAHKFVSARKIKPTEK